MNRLLVTVDGEEYAVEMEQSHADQADYVVRVNGEELTVYVPTAGDYASLEWIVIDGHPYEIAFDRDLRWMQSRAGRHHIEVHDLLATVTRPISTDGRVKAPIPGRIARVLVELGQSVELGQPLTVLEAMKMENEIRSPRAGIVRQVNIVPGQTVVLGELIIDIE